MHIIAKIEKFCFTFVQSNKKNIFLMKKHIIKTIIAIAAAVQCFAASAATVIKTDPAVSSGKLDCGLSYYIVSNPSKKGLADFALVRKLDMDSTRTLQDEIAVARGSLDSLPHFTHRSPLDFLSGNGIVYPRTGYFSVEKDAVLYHFRDIRLDRTAKIADSTLLLLFDIVQKLAEASDRPDSLGRNVGDQAVIVAGDIDKAAMLKKMDMLSLMINKGADAVPAMSDSTVHDSGAGACGLELHVREDSLSGTASVNAAFYGPAMSREHRGTTAYLLSVQFWNEFRTAFEMRMSSLLGQEGIPCPAIRLHCSDCPDACGKEKYTISVLSAAADTARVESLLLSVLSDLKREGLAPEEYSFVRAISDNSLYMKSLSHSADNADYVRKCFSAFVYGSGIVSAADEADFFLSSGLPDSVRNGFLNRYLASLLPDISEAADIRSQAAGLNLRDTLLFPGGQTKVRIRKMRNNKDFGGSTWIFSNGMTVMYKKMETGGRMYYSWVLRGGIASVADLKAGEGAFYPDMLFTGRICGIEGPVFRKMLAAEGISMDVHVGFADMKISGSLPFDRMTLLMKALTAVSTGYSADGQAGLYYMESERMRLSSARGEYRSRLAVIDSIMYPGYRYYLNKSLAGLYPDLPSRAEQFYKARFSRANDGALILVGDMDEYDVKKILESYLGDFLTQKYEFRRPHVMYQPLSGWSTYVSDGRVASLDAVMSTRLMMNSSNYMSAQIVTMAMAEVINRTLAASGMTANISGSVSMFPHERYTVSVSAMPVSLSSLPSSVVSKSYYHVLYDIRSAIAGLADKGLDDSLISVYKSALSDRYASMQQNPEYWIKAMSDRVVSGKNLDFGYGDKISAVTADNVNAVLKSLYEGSLVEYIIKKD